MALSLTCLGYLLVGVRCGDTVFANADVHPHLVAMRAGLHQEAAWLGQRNCMGNVTLLEGSAQLTTLE